jgi:hypothetical protein
VTVGGIPKLVECVDVEGRGRLAGVRLVLPAAE